MSQKQHIFGYFSTTIGWNHSLFSAFATIHSILTEIRQTKRGRFQIGFLKNFSDYTLGIVLIIRVFAKNFLFLCSQAFRIVLSVMLEGATTLIRGTGLILIISFVFTTLRSMGVLHSVLFVTKEKH